jgi:hypothetical protein
MRHFKLVFAALMLVVMCTTFFTGTASAKTLAGNSAHSSKPAACSTGEVDNESIYDGALRLGYTKMVWNTCDNEVYEATVVAEGLVLPAYAYIYNASSRASSQGGWTTANVVNTGWIWYKAVSTSGEGCIQWSGSTYCAYTLAY